MKNIPFYLLFLLPLVGASQEIGSAGRWLKNENRRNAAMEENARADRSYRWEMTYDAGYAEVFIRIPEMGRFTISLGDQEISNNNGIFRFFDVPAQSQQLSISYGRKLIYRVTINPLNNTRLVLDFFSQQGLFLLEEVDLANVREVHYGSRWNDVWNHSYGRPMRNNDFHSFYTMFKEQAFDDGKLRFFRMQKNITAFTTDQISELMDCLSFDKNRLTLAKEAYENVIDPQNYYKLHGKFSFRSGAKDFAEFLEERNNRR